MKIPAGEHRRSSLHGTGAVLRDSLEWEDVLEIVRTAEDTGYRAVFLPEISGREAFGTLAALGRETTRLYLGTGVVTVWARDPTVTAMAAATVQDLSGGRLVLGIGAGVTRPGAQTAVGPLDRMRRYVAVLRAAFTGEPVGPDDLFHTQPFQLELPLDVPPPIWLGALGDRMVALAGEIADGVILNWCTRERVEEARRTIAEAARGAGRDPEEVTLSVYVRACLGVEDDVAQPALREMTGRYASIPAYRRQMERMGLGEDAAVAAKAFEAGRRDDVPASLVRSLTVTGGRKDAQARLESYLDAGADLVLVYPVVTRDAFSSILGTVLAAAPSPAIER